MVCVNASVSFQCTPGTPQPEVCDGYDNDCDGTNDDNVPVPTGVPALYGTKLVDNTIVLDWSATPGTSFYDTTRGSLSALRGSGGNFTSATCMQNDNTLTQAWDPAIPTAGDGTGTWCVPPTPAPAAGAGTRPLRPSRARGTGSWRRRRCPAREERYAPARVSERKRLSLSRLLLFSALPALVLVAAIELTFRALELARPRLASIPLPEETFGIVEPDPDLFWRLKPDMVLDYGGEKGGCRTNALGLRSAPLGPKQAGEFRILALGESTTFGVGVPDRLAYPQRLESLLHESGVCPRCRVINAGVSAWSSFQSRRYLETRGLALQPDLVLVYHEINDYMPASFRNAGRARPPCCARTCSSTPRCSSPWDAASSPPPPSVRWVAYHRARRQVAALRESPRFVDPASIGLPEIGLRPLVVRTADARRAPVNESALPTRVPPGERRRMLEEMLRLCRGRGIAFVVLHPSYRATVPHSCVLTEFCRETGVPMLDAQAVLHPQDVPVEAMYLDKMHPTARGQEALARALQDFLASRKLLPRRGVRRCQSWDDWRELRLPPGDGSCPPPNGAAGRTGPPRRRRRGW
jgi:lysophospholipase L1-like esterase